jgi:hypothetical protein
MNRRKSTIRWVRRIGTAAFLALLLPYLIYSFEFASYVVSDLPRLEAGATRIGVRDLCPLYNNGWNEFDEVQDDGSLKTVKNPRLDDAEFASKLTLDEIGITGNESIDFWYENSNLFWGHGVLVSALDGLDLSNAQAELIG